MKFQDDISNMNTYIHTYVRTYIRTSRNQYAPPLFQSWGHNKKKGADQLRGNRAADLRGKICAVTAQLI